MQLVAWRDSNLYRFTRKANAEFTEQSFIISVLEQPDFQRLSLFTSDAIHNLRSALDHLVYAIAVFRTGQNPLPNPRDLNFPIRSNAQSFREATSGALSNLGPSVLNEIERFQPYKRPHYILPPLLLLLRKLDDIDKHRSLNVVIANIGDIGSFEVLESNSVVLPLESYRFTLYTGEVKDGTEIAKFVFYRPRPNANAKFEAHIVMSITNPLESGNKRLELAYMLPEIALEVGSVIARVKSVA